LTITVAAILMMLFILSSCSASYPASTPGPGYLMLFGDPAQSITVTVQ
jgi:hypothetical protein